MTEQLKTAGPRSLQEARRAVEQSRERVSATLDELEDRIVETKQSIQRKADVVKPAREAIRKAPLIALGIAVAVGIFLGTRGGDDDVDEDGWEKSERKALEEWRVRRRKMLLEEAEDASEEFEDEEEDHEPGPFNRFLRSIAHEVAGVAVGVIGAEIAERLYGARSNDDDEEYDDDADGMSPEIASRFDGLHDGADSEHLYDDDDDYEFDEYEELEDELE